MTAAAPRLRWVAPQRLTIEAGAVDALEGSLEATDRIGVVTSPSLTEVAGSLLDGRQVSTLVTRGEPTVASIETLVEQARAAGVERLVGLGGGSVLDSTKAVAAFVPDQGAPIAEHLEVVGTARSLQAAPLPYVALPTTAGTGAEVTHNAVLGVPGTGRKVSLRAPCLVARAALVDPQLAEGVPHAVAAAAAIDASVQLVEAYCTPRASALTDAVAWAGLERGLHAAERTVNGRADERDGWELAFAATMSGLALANGGLGTIHGFAGALGGSCDLSHGELCAVFAQPVLEITIERLRREVPDSPALVRYAAIAGIIASDDVAAEPLSAWFGSLAAAIRPATDQLAALSTDDVVERVRSASSSRGNPVRLSDRELATVFERVAR